MGIKDFSLSKNQLRSSYLTSIVSMALVIFLLGLLAFIILNGTILTDYIKENIGISVFINDNARDVEIVAFQKELDASAYVKSTEFISKEKAARDFQQELGQDFVSFIGYNPLLPSIEVKLHAAYTHEDSLLAITSRIQNNPIVKEVFYQQNLISQLNENIRKLSMVLALFCALMLIISIALINNTIRLIIYSRRFIIHTMQLVGATPAFVHKPFIIKGILHGIYGSLLAAAMLSGVIYIALDQVPEFIFLAQWDVILIVFAGMFLAGILFSAIFTFLSVNKYLRVKTDRLYI